MDILNLFVLAGYEISLSQVYIVKKNHKIILDGDVSTTPTQFLDNVLVMIGAQAIVEHVNNITANFSDYIYEDAWTTPGVDDVFKRVCQVEIKPHWKGKTFKEIGLLVVKQEACYAADSEADYSEHYQNVPL